MNTTLVSAAGALLFLGATATAQSVILEDFSAGTGGWVMGPFAVNTVHETMGGNPGGWVHGTMGQGGNPDLYGPVNDPNFSGDYRTKGVSGARADLRQDQLGTGQQFSVWLLLQHDPDPMVMFDEVSIAVQADGMPLSPPQGAGWFSYHWTIPSGSTTLPAGWIRFGGGTNDAAWNLVIQDVTNAQVHFANNPFIGFDLIPFQDWDFGMDNFGLEVPAGEAFCFGDGGNQLGCTDCPCGNNAALGSGGGCNNSNGTSARLVSSGNPNVSGPMDTLHFDVLSANPSTFGILTSGDNRLPNNPVNPCFGLDSGVTSTVLDGLRCIGANIIRHGSRSSDANGDIGVTTNGWGPPNNPLAGIGVTSGFVAGQTRHFQCFYREAANLVCLTGQNTTNGVSVTFN